VHLDHELDVGSDRLAHRLDQPHHEAELLPGQGARRSAKRVHLQRPVAALDHALRGLRHRRRVPLGVIPAVGIGGHAASERAAEQLPDRHAERLADQVPAGDLKGGQRRHGDLAWSAVLGDLDVPCQPLDVEGVAADDVPGGELVDAGQKRVGLVDHAHLAQPDEAVVGLELQKGQFPPRRPDHGRLQVHDLHGSLLVICGGDVHDTMAAGPVSRSGH
jgi:hypothetical protein